MAGGRGFYNAAATYTGTASSKYATGCTVTADYAGEVTKTTSGTVLYTAVFGLAEEQEAVTAIHSLPRRAAALTGAGCWSCPPGRALSAWYSWAASCFKVQIQERVEGVQ
ncbi:MAG: hypothetical protein ACLTYN_06475 [Dysosmobacter welbionis]